MGDSAWVARCSMTTVEVSAGVSGTVLGWPKGRKDEETGDAAARYIRSHGASVREQRDDGSGAVGSALK